MHLGAASNPGKVTSHESSMPLICSRLGVWQNQHTAYVVHRPNMGSEKSILRIHISMIILCIYATYVWPWKNKDVNTLLCFVTFKNKNMCSIHAGIHCATVSCSLFTICQWPPVSTNSRAPREGRSRCSSLQWWRMTTSRGQWCMDPCVGWSGPRTDVSGW